MFVRLAFAVAALLEPEILLVDEVLAVGDINFQKKCLGKMGDVARAGRTVVLVSHQLNQVRRLCNRVVWIDAGAVRQNGGTHEVVSAYESAMARGDSNGHSQDRGSSTKGSFLRWRIADPRSDDPHVLTTLGPVAVKVAVDIRHPIRKGHHGMGLYNHDRQLIWGWATDGVQLPAGEHEFCHTFPMLPLRPGRYRWLATLYDDGDLLDWWDCVPEMIVAIENYQHPRDEWNGFLNVPTRFEIDGGGSTERNTVDGE